MEAAALGGISNGVKISNKLDLNYNSFPDNAMILGYVRKGEAIFRKELQECILCNDCTSVVDLYSVVSEEFFDFVFFLLANPGKIFRMFRQYMK